MTKFKVGDRVKAVKPVGTMKKTDIFGTIKQILENDEVSAKILNSKHMYAVEFDENIGGHTTNKLCKAHTGWFCTDEIVPCSKIKPTLYDKILELTKNGYELHINSYHSDNLRLTIRVIKNIRYYTVHIILHKYTNLEDYMIDLLNSIMESNFDTKGSIIQHVEQNPETSAFDVIDCRSFDWGV